MTTIFLSLFGISVSISMMVLALILLTPFLNKRYAAKWKYLIWIILALRLLIPVSGVNGQSAGEMLSRVRALTEPGSEEKETDTQTNAAAGRIIVQLPAQMTAPIAGQTALQTGSPSAGITALDIVICVWMAGSLIV
ncbi:MAG: M56 family metallopeptidase, partial [Lachnospiraceae bacterium]|nr:M56 family metallopeptidase [Lachnospiraceae bacterium]